MTRLLIVDDEKSIRLAKPFLGSVMIRIRRAIACCGCATCSLRWIESNTCGVVLPTEAAW